MCQKCDANNGKLMLGPNVPPQRIHGPWSLGDLERGISGKGPIDLYPQFTKTGKPRPLELHHADNMPGSAIHEVFPSHTKDVWHQTNNQGVTNVMRRQDSQLHWYFRAQEMGGN